MALQLPWRFVKKLDADNGWRVAPDPCTLRAIASAGLERLQAVLPLLPRLGEHGLPIGVPRLPGRGAIGQTVADRRVLPDRVFARRRRRFGDVQAFGDLTATQLFFHQRTIDIPADGGFDRV